MLLVEQPTGSLLAGTWVLPAVEREEGESAPQAARRALAALGLSARQALRAAGEIRHVFTHRDVTATVLRARATGEPPGAARWVEAAGDPAVPLSAFTRKMLALLPGTARGTSVRRT